MDFKDVLKSTEFGIFVAFLALCAILSFATPNFLSIYNISTVMKQVSFIAIMSVGMTMVILTAGIDLSVGAVLGLVNVLAALFINKFGLAPGIGTALLCGAFLGFVNGIIIVKWDLPPFIVTLGMMNIARGLALVITKGWPITGIPECFGCLAEGRLIGIPVPVIIMIIIYILGYLFLSRTIWGRYIYASGGNEKATWLSGVNVNKIKILVYTITGFLSGLAGIMLASRLSQGSPITGTGYELSVIGAVVIGGTDLMGGKGSVLGSLIGALIMGVLDNGLVLLGVSAFWQQVILGVVIIVAVAGGSMRRKLFMKGEK
ncbi:ABC transporter permease [candidate division WOR-3 bacterium]|nr:ABC transporter permease [candidate division WOR-3 bacterium]